MRATAFTVLDSQGVELFTKKLRGGFEIWVVGHIKGHPVILDHHLTHDDLEARLEYARAGDLAWRDAKESQIPGEKHKNAIEMEKTIKDGTFCDFDDPQLDEMEALAQRAAGLPPSPGTRRSVAMHLNSLVLLAADKEGIRKAKKALLGRWTDGVVTLALKPNHKLKWSCNDPQHPLNVGERIHKHSPDWWNFAMWRLHLMNDEHKCGTHVGVLRVDEQQLHLFTNHPHRIVQVFHRDKSAGAKSSEAESR